MGGSVILEILTGSWNLVKMGGSAIGGFLSKLNAQGVAGLAVALVLAGLCIHEWGEQRHWHKQSDRYEKLYNADEADAKRIAAQAIALKQQIDALSSSISAALKEKHDAEDSRIGADADAVRVRGPGKAVCASHAQLPAGASGHEQAAPAATNAGPQVPAGDWAAVPWSWLVTVIEEHDQLLNDDKTWSANDQQQRAIQRPPETRH